MSDPINDGGHAFPSTHTPLFPLAGHPGMSLRDYLAAKAMQAFIAGGWFAQVDMEAMVRRAYEVAALMLAERAKAQP